MYILIYFIFIFFIFCVNHFFQSITKHESRNFRNFPSDFFFFLKKIIFFFLLHNLKGINLPKLIIQLWKLKLQIMLLCLSWPMKHEISHCFLSVLLCVCLMLFLYLLLFVCFCYHAVDQEKGAWKANVSYFKRFPNGFKYCVVFSYNDMDS